MKPKASTVAQKLLNLYRQAHVIIGGWGALNPIFVEESTPDVMETLIQLPTGKMLAKHIENLKSGKTPMNSIERDLLPYGGMMAESAIDVDISATDWQELESAILNFTPDQEGLDKIEKIPVVQSFGPEWLQKIHSLISVKHPELLQNWATVDKTYNAYMRWNTANDLIANPLSDRARAQLQADMPEYETYLPMFGESGTQLLEKLRTSISSIPHAITQD
ncbi:MAG: hypothetical protein J5679_02755 [Alphaproteobacteria bacterium]|nr:hypothetical protein [Alphaproteobacteria bacterium]